MTDESAMSHNDKLSPEEASGEAILSARHVAKSFGNVHA